MASTPGKTKHFQTIHLDPLPIILCDCPGLVFPSFATTKADMVTNGILPIDQMREPTGPSELVAQRIPKRVLEKVYGIRIKTRDLEGHIIDRQPTAEELLKAFAVARGFTKSSQGNPDEHRAARHILKDYVNGKLLFAFPPPELDAADFNAPTFSKFMASKERVSMFSSKILGRDALDAEKNAAGAGIRDVDDNIQVKLEASSEFHLVEEAADIAVGVKGKSGDFNGRAQVFPHQSMLDSKGFVKVAAISEKGEKKHKKGKKNVKKRTQWTKEDD